jgi:hypothetical protein
MSWFKKLCSIFTLTEEERIQAGIITKEEAQAGDLEKFKLKGGSYGNASRSV